MDSLTLVAEHCANARRTFAFPDDEILGRENDRVTSETIEAWHTGTNSINRCVLLPKAYQALRTQLSERRSKRGKNTFMGKVEMTRIQDTTNDLDFSGRYEDDIFSLMDTTTDTDVLVQKFNSAHPSLKFSAELESDNEIALLDVLLQR
ncbi:hypothetical protein SprV_0602070500 [Sparganum proliferum]